MTTLPERYRRWFTYEKEMHRKVLASLETVPEGARGEAAFAKAADLFAHLIVARRLWLSRFGVAEPPDELFPAAVDRAALPARLEAMEAAWDAWLDRLDEAEIEREFEYTSSEGGRFRNRVDDILTQLFGHSWYHRGQIAAIVRALGGTPAATDFVFWTREPLPE